MIKRIVFILFLLALPSLSLPMHKKNDTRPNEKLEMALIARAHALSVSIDTHDIQDLARINPEDIQSRSIVKVKNDDVETYHARISGCDRLFTRHFLSGDAKGTISCSRITFSGKNIPIDASYFSLLKSLYEERHQEEDPCS